MHVTVTLAFLRKEMLLLRQNASIFVFLFVIPVFLSALLSQPLGQLGDTRGPDQTVPGSTLMFGFYVVMFMTGAHFHEHGWGSWTLVRASGLSRSAMAFQTALPYFLLSAAQMLIMVVVGNLVFDARVNGSLLGLVLLVIATAASWTAIALFLLNVTSSLTIMTNLANMLGLSMGLIAGALVPREEMPDWSQAVARATPHFWSLEGLKGVLSREEGLVDVLPHVAVLALFAGLVFRVAVTRFDPARSRKLPMR